jgi:ParB-like chromosome segregation protein Spo0J
MDSPFPPIVFDPKERSIIDGTHRVNAALRRGDTHIWAYVGG